MNSQALPSANASKTPQVFLVSLETASVRRAQSTRRLQKLGLDYSVVDAVDGSALPRAAIARNYDARANGKKFKRRMSRFEIGCYLSHLDIWKRVAAGDRPAVVLEDDFEADDDLPALLAQVARAAPPCSIVKLYSSPRLSRKIARLSRKYSLTEPLIAPGFTVGYIITPEAASALVADAVPFGRPVDMDIKHWWEFGIRVLTVQPSPVRPRKRYARFSAISSSRESMKGSRIVRLARNLQYQGGFLGALARARAAQLFGGAAPRSAK